MVLKISWNSYGGNENVQVRHKVLISNGRQGCCILDYLSEKFKFFKDVRILNCFFFIVEAFILLISYKRKRMMSVKQHFFRIYRT